MLSMEELLDNLLWKESPDLELLEKIRTVKRESRMSRDNYETGGDSWFSRVFNSDYKTVAS